MRLGDFCVISYLYHKYAGSKEPYGTLINMAPEVFEEGEGDKSDVWSLGMTLLELAERKHPYKGLFRSEVVEKLTKELPPSLSSGKWSPEFVDFVSKCLVRGVEERWSVEQLMEVSGLSED